MSRVANNPITIPVGVDVNLSGQMLVVKGKEGSLNHTIHDSVEMLLGENVIRFKSRFQTKEANALSGTTRAMVNNMVLGVSKNFEKKLTLIGVGYRAQVSNKILNLSLGFSHPVEYKLPEGISIETPSQTEIIIKGCNKQIVGQVAADIRAYRPPEPYKGKGIRYADEQVARKEAKKK